MSNRSDDEAAQLDAGQAQEAEAKVEGAAEQWTCRKRLAEPEEEAETYSYFKTALSWDPSEEIIRKGQKPFQREAEPISIRSKYYYN